MKAASLLKGTLVFHFKGVFDKYCMLHTLSQLARKKGREHRMRIQEIIETTYQFNINLIIHRVRLSFRTVFIYGSYMSLENRTNSRRIK